MKIGEYTLDNIQSNIACSNDKYMLVSAGAGSGKTLTILGRVNYLVNVLGVHPNEILCISFTRASSVELRKKLKDVLNLDMCVFTFHKLSLEIIKKKGVFYSICEDGMLDNIINEFFKIKILSNSEYMKMVLYYFNIKYKKNIKELYLSLVDSKEFLLFMNLISTFINLFKCNGFVLSDFNLFLSEAKKTFFFSKYKHEKIFLIFALNVYLIYQEYLNSNNEIDFNDMISIASDFVCESKVNLDFKYVIIDEYQDTSFVRFNLVKNIVNSTNSSLMVVGDDFQSIYRFTGCDVSLFLDFRNYFYDASTQVLETTYRNSQELVSVAGNFVMKNKKQLKKSLKSNKSLEKPIKVIMYSDIKSSFFNLVLDIYEDTKKPIMVLGRNNRDIDMVLGDGFSLDSNGNIVCSFNKSIVIYYLTVHKSKGLEEENVIVINLCDSFLGFPNKIRDDKVLRFVSLNSDKFPFSEERRLFYVALTRTKNYVYLLVPKSNPSVFVRELIKDYKMYIDFI